MKKFILSSLVIGLFCTSANAYQETETYTIREKFRINIEQVEKQPMPVAKVRCAQKQGYATSLDLAKAQNVNKKCACNPCNSCNNDLIPVKTHTEVIEHYQLYKPVVKYVPAGTYAHRTIVSNDNNCVSCK